MMNFIVGFFLIAALLIYCVTGGADFGAGILEAILPKSLKPGHRHWVKKAISPVWEANHVWLIILIVIMFVGYPPLYQQVVVTFHIPLTLMLIGIIIRGCAFVFRHYSPTEQADSRLYSWAFSLASIFTPFFLGTVIGGLAAGLIPVNPTSFSDAYIHPWLNPFALSVGLFVTAIFAYLASAYLIAETESDESAQTYRSLALKTQLAMVAIGGIVLFTGSRISLNLIGQFLTHRLSLLLFIGASLSVIWGWRYLGIGNRKWLRIMATTQVLMVIAAWLWIVYPALVRYSDGTVITLADHAGKSSMDTLAICLLVGSLVIFPSLAYLLQIFKFKKEISSPLT